jgi:hypothetical protein
MIYPEHRPELASRLWTRLAPVAWSVLAILLLAAVLFVRQSEAAGTLPQAATASSVEEEEVESEEEAESEEGEEESEDEEEDDDESPGTVGALFLPPECLIHTAEAHVAASASHGVVQLTVHYTSYEPADVTVGYWLKGGKGSLQLGETKRHFTRQGIFRDEEHVSDRAMSKVLAARAFIVQLDIAGAPSSCDRYSTQRLTAKHGSGGHATWSRPR